MTFLTAHLGYFGRWLLSYTDGVELISGEPLRGVMKELVQPLVKRWNHS